MTDVKLFTKETRAYWWGTSTHVVGTVPPDDGRVIRTWEVWQRTNNTRYVILSDYSI